MVVEMRSGRPVTAPSLRHEDLVELAASLGDTPESIEARLVVLLGADTDDAAAIRSMILPSTAANSTRRGAGYPRRVDGDVDCIESRCGAAPPRSA